MDDVIFDFEEIFGEDYLYFYDFATEQSDRDAEVISRILQLSPGDSVLDLACGYGRIANRLSMRGCAVTGLDRSDAFLKMARADAAQKGATVTYVLGDMRRLPWVEQFDAVVSWFTSFGYFEDGENRSVLTQVASVLRQGGRFILEHMNRDWLVKAMRSGKLDTVKERDGNYMIDRVSYSPIIGRTTTERITVRGNGPLKRAKFSVRLFTFTELRDWILQSGFDRVEGFGRDGQPLTNDSDRLIVLAEKRAD